MDWRNFWIAYLGNLDVSKHFMKGLNKYIWTLALTAILCSTKTKNSVLNKYQGGNPDYSEVTLFLYSDSTYSYYERQHMCGIIQDTGKWTKNNDYYLNSTIKSSWTNMISEKLFRFEMQRFIIYGDTLKLIPKDKKDIRYFNAYYKLHKVPN